MYSIEEFDNAKTKILKYICFKKRTEKEIRNKFSKAIEENLLEDVIEELKEIGYINDSNYIKRALNEFMSLNNMSIKEVKYKLLTKGIKSNILEDYISDNYDTLLEFEKKSAKRIAIKKSALEKNEIKNYLIKKGYKEESIKEAI
mgnify:CR=1 FL=1